MGDYFEHLESAWWVAKIGATPLIYVSVSVLHYFTIFLLVGSVSVIDLRLLGVLARKHRLAELADEIFPLMWTFLTICLVTGILLFLPAGGDYYTDPHKIMIYKVLVILLAIVTAIFLRSNIEKWDRLPQIPPIAKVVAVLSLLLWVGAILMGTFIAAISGLG